jgi:hypothetical protein
MSIGRRVVARTQLRDLLVEVREAASRFEADRWSGADCARVAEELARAAKACAAASARAAARAVECHQGDVEWVARTAGVTPSQVRESLATTAALGECPATSEAVADGSVSLTQAREIVRAEAAVAGSEIALLEVARTRGIAGLREESRKVVLGSIDRDELHRRQQAARSVRHWIDDEGMVAGGFRLPPEVGVPFVNRLDAETDRVHREARRRGSTEARDAHAADALLRMSAAGAKGKANRADVVFVCSLDSYRRGHTEGDELCHVIGSGPVPVSVVRDAVANDAFVKAVLVRGVEIHKVVHFGRKMKAELRTALDLGPAPTFEGAVCIEPGCDRRHGLEWDHDDPVANDGVTSYENMKARCRPDHWSKTERDRRAGLLGGRRKERGPP